MKKEWYILIILLFLVITIQQCFLISANSRIEKIIYENGRIKNDIETLQSELIERNKVILTKTELLERVKKSNTFKEYVSIWKELNN